MAIALVESQFGPTSTRNLRKITFFAIFAPIFFSFFVLLAGNFVLYQCHSIFHVLPLYFLIEADLLDLTREDKKDPGQKKSRTRWIQDKSVFFSALPFFISPLLMFFKNFFFGLQASRRGLFFCQNSILKKLNKFLFHFYIVFCMFIFILF